MTQAVFVFIFRCLAGPILFMLRRFINRRTGWRETTVDATELEAIQLGPDDKLNELKFIFDNDLPKGSRIVAKAKMDLYGDASFLLPGNGWYRDEERMSFRFPEEHDGTEELAQ